MRVTLDDLPPKYRAQALAQINRAVPAPDVEPDSRHEPVGAQAPPRLDSQGRVRLHFLCARKRLADPDGLSAKAFIDGLRHGGVLQDDSTAQVSEVTFSQRKTRKDEPETTQLTVFAEDA